MSLISALNETVLVPISSIISSPAFEVGFFIFTSVAGILGEHEYNITNRIIKFIYRASNKQAEIKLNIKYSSKKDFDSIKSGLKDYFITAYNNNELNEYKVHAEKQNYITLSFDIFTVKIMESVFHEIFFDFVKTGCGIRDLKSKVTKLVGILEAIDRKQQLFEKMTSCEVTIYLPYKCSSVKIYPPPGFSFDNYLIHMHGDDIYKTKINMRLNSINATGKSFGEITELLQKLL
ncbi:MAG: hypothetical protein QM426_08240 [Euryarchaeota archaeon]|nr:hypothetical protein [Euryarchaeota archaeon]